MYSPSTSMWAWGTSIYSSPISMLAWGDIDVLAFHIHVGRGHIDVLIFHIDVGMEVQRCAYFPHPHLILRIRQHHFRICCTICASELSAATVRLG